MSTFNLMKTSPLLDYGTDYERHIKQSFNLNLSEFALTESAGFESEKTKKKHLNLAGLCKKL